MAETLRLFVAIVLPAPILERLAVIQQQVRADTPHGVVRWVDRTESTSRSNSSGTRLPRSNPS